MGRHREAREASLSPATADPRVGSWKSRRPWLPAALCGLLILAAVTWLVLPAGGSTSPDDAATASPSASGGAGQPAGGSDPSGADSTPTTTWEATTPDPDVNPPNDGSSPGSSVSAVSVTVPSIGVDSSLVPLGVDPGSGVLVPPDRYDVAGVFTAGPVPGGVGPAIIAGHVDSRAGPGVFYRLEEMVPGETITVLLSDGQRIDFRVVEVAQYPKSAFPTSEVYGPTPDRELRLITCGGTFDASRRSYLDNIVVYAVRV